MSTADEIMLTSAARTPRRSRTAWNTARPPTAVTRPAISPKTVMPIVPRTIAQVSDMPNRAPPIPLVTRLPMSTNPPIAVTTPRLI